MKIKNFEEIFKKRIKGFKIKYNNLIEDYSEENIHQFRVAYRRLSSYYKFLSYFGYKPSKKFSKKVKNIFTILGEMRDYQVNLIVLKNIYFSNSIPEDISNIFTEEIEKDKKDLIDLIKKEEKDVFRGLEKEEKRFSKFNKDIKNKDFKYLFKKVKDDLESNYKEKLINKSQDLNELHKLRLSVKKYRYFLENFSDFLEKDSKEEINGLKTIQELLGDINDLDVLRNNIEKLSLKVEEKIIGMIEVRLQNKIKEFRINF